MTSKTSQDRIAHMAALAPRFAIASHYFSAGLGAALEPHGMTFTQLSILSHMSRHPDERPGINDLADAIQMNQPATTKAVQGMVEQGWLSRQKDDTDTRRVRLALEKAGLAALDDARQVALPALEKLFSGMSNKELDTLLRLLEKIPRI